MTMIKYDSPNNVISAFNPIISLNAQVRQTVNQKLIEPKLRLFFQDKGGINSYEALDTDKIKTEIEFLDFKVSYIQTYLYKELIQEINKDSDGKINFKPRYAISFDQDLANFKEYKGIKYGELKLGQSPILYIIYIDLQEVIKFIKELRTNISKPIETLKVVKTPEDRRNQLIDELVAVKHREYLSASPTRKSEIKADVDRLVNLSRQKIQGNSGQFRVNLSWNTTDDLDLEIHTEGGVINYKNTTVEYHESIGKLDVDANATTPLVSNPQENITWDKIPQGKHTVSVNFYRDREKKGKVPFTIFIENGDDSRVYNSFVEFRENFKTRKVAEFKFLDGQLHITNLL
ncbi:hypothetical protein PN462_04280 [Spirulina sp. CS-785/01]|uniref:hypothetical protein n=1 Tax=Spirulina sp. CS-785/01 TaxID=3021716 RepID=UPI0023314190|nr:hypothetical protein [Spirulina sp. CS-785/01]MDB9312311.1 hypothetical protein [Spirulina sp. CS-785/01]